MPKLTLKLPRRIQRAEIIRAKDVDLHNVSAFMPLNEIPPEVFKPEPLDIEVIDTIDLDYLRELAPPEPELVEQEFFF